ncbi:MAG: P-loop NTPase fold protein [Metamycoplasmataceae bacterium]
MKNNHKIVVDFKDNDLKKQCSYFFKQIEEDYSKFLKELEKNEIKFEEIKNKYNCKSDNDIEVDFIPENISIKSPLTIINAPWGTGKTYFIEKMAKYIMLNDECIKLRKIKRIIIIDAWKFSSANNIPDDLISELFKIILEKKDSGLKTSTLKIVKNIFNVWAIPWVNKFTGMEIPKIEEKNLNNEEQIIEMQKIINDPILIILDNIERLEEDAWEIIKAIQKMSIYRNFLFVLPMNKDKLRNSENGEWKIDKYITLPYYDFTQNYKGLLKSESFNGTQIEILNDLLQIEFNNKNLTLREVSRFIKKENLLEEFKKSNWHGLFLIYKNWPIKEKIEEKIYNLLNKFFEEEFGKIILSFDKIHEFNNYEEPEQIVSFWEDFKLFYNDQVVINNFNLKKIISIDFFDEFINNVIYCEDKYFNNVSYNWEEEWNNYKNNNLNLFYNEFEDKRNLILDEIKIKEREFLLHKKELKEFNSKIESISKELSKIEEKSKNNVETSEKEFKLREEIKTHKKNEELKESEIEELRIYIEKINDIKVCFESFKKNDIKNLITKFDKFISNFKKNKNLILANVDYNFIYLKIVEFEKINKENNSNYHSSYENFYSGFISFFLKNWTDESFYK